MAMIQVEVFWFVSLCCVVVGNQRFGGLRWFHLQGEVTGDGRYISSGRYLLARSICCSLALQAYTYVRFPQRQ
jgi:hypothetical protein